MPRNPAPEPAWTQLSLTGDADVETFRRDEVLAIDPAHTTNGERVADLARLGYLNGRVIDPTYGYGGMWTHFTPDELLATDLDAAKSPTGESVSFLALPYPDHHADSTLYDPPYRHAGTPTNHDGHDDQYGTDVYRTKAEQTALILGGATECSRVTSGFLIVKCQDQVVADCVNFQTRTVIDHVATLGWELKDRLHLLSYRAQPAGRSQQNARNNFSTFLVFRPAARTVNRHDEALRTAP